MIRSAGQVVNDGLDVVATDPPALAGFDIPLSIANVQSLGGSAALYTHFLSAALASAPVEGDGVLAVAALCAWRSGVLGLRSDALGRLDDALESGSPAPASVAAALGLAQGAVADFARAQRVDRFAWPGSPAGERVVGRVGGFRGLGGPWIAPPVAVHALDREGGFAIHTVADDWILDCDVFCARLDRTEDVLPTPAATSRGAELRIAPSSYLATLVFTP